jgi:hypothetical protein
MRSARFIQGFALFTATSVAAFLTVPLELSERARHAKTARTTSPAIGSIGPSNGVGDAPNDERSSRIDAASPPARRPADLAFFSSVYVDDITRPAPASAIAVPELGPRCDARDPLAGRIRLHLSLLDDEDADHTRDVLYLLGANHLARFDYGRAADFYEIFARHHPAADGERCDDAERAAGVCADAPLSLRRAFELRRALGERDAAIADAARFVDTYGETRIDEAARLSIDAGALLEGEEARAHYEAHVRRFERHTPSPLTVRAYVELGRARFASGDNRGARRAFREADLLFARSAGSEAALSADAPGEENGAEFRRTVYAAAEARFYLGEIERAAFRSRRLAPYAGDYSAPDIARWAARELRPWVRTRLSAMRRAEREYDEAAELGVVEWKIAADARRGEIYRELVDVFRNAPVPAYVTSEGEEQVRLRLRADWQALSLKLSPHAEAAFERCEETAVRTRHFGEWSELCAEGLTAIDPVRHPARHEIVPVRLEAPSTPVAPSPRPPPIDTDCTES